VLVPFPFSDLSTSKVRPAVALSATSHGEDLIFAFISSNVTRAEQFDIKIKTSDKNFVRTGLRGDSVIRISKLATLDRKIILGELGVLGAEHLKQIKMCLKKIFAV